MDGFTYVNIFDTKGIEYIVIIIFLLSLIPFYIILNKKEEIYSEFRTMKKQLSEKIMNIPYGIFHSRNHTWAYLNKSGKARIGLDDFVLHLTGTDKIHQIKEPDEEVKKGELIAQLGLNGRTLRVYSPVTGKIAAINPVLDVNPSVVSADPYNKGWIYDIIPYDWKNETSEYYLAEEAKQWLVKESVRVKDFFARKFEFYNPELIGITLQDGGELSENVLSDMPDEFWHDFQKEFLDPV